MNIEKKISPRILYKKLKTGPKKNGNRTTSLPLLKRKQKKMRNLLFTKKTQTKIQNPNQKPVLDLKQQRRNAIEERRTRKQKT